MARAQGDTSGINFVCYYIAFLVLGIFLRWCVRKNVRRRNRALLMCVATSIELYGCTLGHLHVYYEYGFMPCVLVSALIGLWHTVTLPRGVAGNPLTHVVCYMLCLHCLEVTVLNIGANIIGCLIGHPFAKMLWQALVAASSHSPCGTPVNVASMHCLSNFPAVTHSFAIVVEMLGAAVICLLMLTTTMSGVLVETATRCLVMFILASSGMHYTGVYLNPALSISREIGCDHPGSATAYFVTYWAAPFATAAFVTAFYPSLCHFCCCLSMVFDCHCRPCCRHYCHQHCCPKPDPCCPPSRCCPLPCSDVNFEHGLRVGKTPDGKICVGFDVMPPKHGDKCAKVSHTINIRRARQRGEDAENRDSGSTQEGTQADEEKDENNSCVAPPSDVEEAQADITAKQAPSEVRTTTGSAAAPAASRTTAAVGPSASCMPAAVGPSTSRMTGAVGPSASRMTGAASHTAARMTALPEADDCDPQTSPVTATGQSASRMTAAPAPSPSRMTGAAGTASTRMTTTPSRMTGATGASTARMTAFNSEAGDCDPQTEGTTDVDQTNTTGPSVARMTALSKKSARKTKAE